MEKDSMLRTAEEPINVGIIGLGYIGSGVFKLIESQKEYIAHKTGKSIKIKRVADKDIRDRAAKFEPELRADTIFSDNPEDIINDPDIDIVVELVGGIDFAYKYLMDSLNKGKYVVTANKDLIANKGESLFAAAADNNVDILFEASVGGGIPIIGPMLSLIH